MIRSFRKARTSGSRPRDILSRLHASASMPISRQASSNVLIRSFTSFSGSSIRVKMPFLQTAVLPSGISISNFFDFIFLLFIGFHYGRFLRLLLPRQRLPRQLRKVCNGTLHASANLRDISEDSFTGKFKRYILSFSPSSFLFNFFFVIPL